VTDNNIIINNSEVFVLHEEALNELKVIALGHPFLRARICLHESLQNKVHEMIIVAHKDGDMPAHSHPADKSESYHMIEGKLKILIFNDDGSKKETIFLSSDAHPKMYRIRGGVWHQPIPLSEWAIYHEVATGPFNKEKDLIFFRDK
jgi:cupin fold WbuC family metalloprotein